MTEPLTPTTPDVVILLPEEPASMGDVFGPVAPALAQALGPMPPVPRLVVPINGVELELGVHTTPCADQALFGDLANSPLRTELDEPVAAHRAHTTISYAHNPDDVWSGLDLVTNMTATILDQSAAVAVWLPEQMLVNTDVLYVGDVARDQPERTWFRVHSMWLDDARTEALGFTRGLARIGWPELQLHGVAQDPGRVWNEFTTSVGSLLAQREPAPVAGGRLTVGEVTYSLRPGTGLLGDQVLELVPEPTDQTEPTDRPKRSWFRRR